MNIVVKSLAVLSAVLLLAACETAPGNKSGQNGSGSGLNGSNGAVPQDGTQNDLAQNVGDRVFFDLDQSTLSAESQQTLERQAEWLKKWSNVSATIEGHCDERGTREYNLALGERRATAAKKYLVGLGISASRLSTISYGKERPAVIGSDESAWGQNRRAVTVLTGSQ